MSFHKLDSTLTLTIHMIDIDIDYQPFGRGLLFFFAFPSYHSSVSVSFFLSFFLSCPWRLVWGRSYSLYVLSFMVVFFL
ncbi:hypothetical protein DFH27DRAFT_562288 [Peziza echinospora]|nr:hypothetical protein DFH27DRAFT_562288 [Peziza echinospora]